MHVVASRVTRRLRRRSTAHARYKLKESARRRNTTAKSPTRARKFGRRKKLPAIVCVFFFHIYLFDESRRSRAYYLRNRRHLMTSRTVQDCYGCRVERGEYYLVVPSRRRSVAIARAGRRARAKRLFGGRARRVAESTVWRRRHRCELHRYIIGTSHRPARGPESWRANRARTTHKPVTHTDRRRRPAHGTRSRRDWNFFRRSHSVAAAALSS